MKLKKLVRKNILELEPYKSARGSNLSGMFMDANENSFGSSVDNFEDLQLNRYPDPYHIRLREELSAYLNVPSENIFCGVGSDEIIDLIIRIFCEPREDKAVILSPTYGMYKVLCAVNDVETMNVPLTYDFQIDVGSTLKSCDDKTKILFCCSPNNPTGNLLKLSDIKMISDNFSGLVVVDEAYVDFAEEYSSIGLVPENINIIIIRTFSKAWGLAGLRLGYCVASKEIIDLLYKIKLPYNLNKFTTMLAVKALHNKKRKDEFVDKICIEKVRMTDELSRIDRVIKIFHSDANFILFEIADAAEICAALAKKEIIVRDRCQDVKNTIRVSVGTPEQNDLFIKELRNLL